MRMTIASRSSSRAPSVGHRGRPSATTRRRTLLSLQAPTRHTEPVVFQRADEGSRWELIDIPGPNESRASSRAAEPENCAESRRPGVRSCGSPASSRRCNLKLTCLVLTAVTRTGIVEGSDHQGGVLAVVDVHSLIRWPHLSSKRQQETFPSRMWFGVGVRLNRPCPRFH